MFPFLKMLRNFVGLNGNCSSSASWVVPGVYSHLEVSQLSARTTSTELGWTRPETKAWAWNEPWTRRGIQDPPPLRLPSPPSLDSIKSRHRMTHFLFSDVMVTTVHHQQGTIISKSDMLTVEPVGCKIPFRKGCRSSLSGTDRIGPD